MRICNVVLAWNQWSVFGNLDDNHAFFHSFVRAHWAYGKNAILELECAFYLTFGTFLEVCIRFFFHLCRIFMRKASWNHCSSSRNLLDCDQGHWLELLSTLPCFCMAVTKPCVYWHKNSCVTSTMCASVLTQDSCVTSTMCYKCTDTRQLRSINHVYKCTDTRQLRSINHVYKCTDTRHVCNFNDVITPHPTHPPQPHVLRSIQHVWQLQRCHYTPPHPPHPNPTCYVASNMCATSTMSLHPTPPTHPNPTCYVASQHACNFNDVITPHPTHPPQPHVLRSIQHVCNFNDVITPPPHPPTPTPRVT